jgi:multisubunit Na+/H+ antiporter MnhB subunit
LVAGAALVLRYLDGGSDGVGNTARVEPPTLLGAGLALAGLTGTASLLGGNAFLESAKATFEVPVLGEVNASSTLPFDVGVYLVVVGLVLMVLRTLGAEGEDGDEDALVPEVDASPGAEQP